MKTVKTYVLLLTLALLFSTTAYSQVKTTVVKKSAYPQFSISPVGGVTFPVGTLGDSYKSGGNFGLDLNYKINKEVGFFGKFGYNFLRSQTAGLPDGKIMEYTAGPRYSFTSRNLKSAFFLEAGAGAYTIQQGAYMLNNIDYPETSATNFGINAGLGAVLNLSKAVDILFKVKYHNIMSEGGSSSFMTPILGIDFRL